MQVGSWLQGPSSVCGEFDVDAFRVRLRAMTDDELLRFGREMRNLVYPLTYGPDGKPQVSAFSIQLDEARAEWRRRSTASTPE